MFLIRIGSLIKRWLMFLVGLGIALTPLFFVVMERTFQIGDKAATPFEQMIITLLGVIITAVGYDRIETKQNIEEKIKELKSTTSIQNLKLADI